MAELLTGVASRTAVQLSELLGAEGVRLEEWRVLHLLADGRGHPMAEVAEAVRLPAPTVTRLIDRMVADNMVYRRADETDKRRLLVYASARGRRRCTALRPKIEAYEGDLLDVVGDDADLVIEVLERLRDQLEPDGSA